MTKIQVLSSDYVLSNVHIQLYPRKALVDNAVASLSWSRRSIVVMGHGIASPMDQSSARSVTLAAEAAHGLAHRCRLQ
jgi:hypothetical protein